MLAGVSNRTSRDAANVLYLKPRVRGERVKDFAAMDRSIDRGLPAA